MNTSIKKELKYFLGETLEEAKVIHDEFVGIINTIAREYSLSTGVDKKELFNEAFIALSNAKKNYIKDKGVPFNKYALYAIKRHLNDYIKDNSVIGIPRYVNRAIALIRRLDSLLETNGYTISAEDYILNNKENIDLNETVYNKCLEIVQYLNNVAIRANVSLEKLIKRANYIPQIIDTLDIEQESYFESDKDIKIMVSNLLNILTEEEKIIAKGIMEGKSKKAIAKELNISDTWINIKLKEIGKKALLPPKNQ